MQVHPLPALPRTYAARRCMVSVAPPVPQVFVKRTHLLGLCLSTTARSLASQPLDSSREDPFCSRVICPSRAFLHVSRCTHAASTSDSKRESAEGQSRPGYKEISVPQQQKKKSFYHKPTPIPQDLYEAAPEKKLAPRVDSRDCRYVSSRLHLSLYKQDTSRDASSGSCDLPHINDNACVNTTTVERRDEIRNERYSRYLRVYVQAKEPEEKQRAERLK